MTDTSNKFQFTSLVNPTLTLTRIQFILFGFIASLVKHNIDRFIAALVLQENFTPINYIEPLFSLTSATAFKGKNLIFIVTMVLVSLPFIWMGLCAVINRLRHAGFTTWLSFLFFVPLANLLLFLILAIAPESEERRLKGPNMSSLDKIIPNSMFGSAALAVVSTVVLAFFLTIISVFGFQNYGAALFVGTPFIQGFMAVVIYNYHQQRRLGSNIGIALFSILLTSAVLFGLAIEGVICLAMAIPLGMLLSALGALLAHILIKISPNRDVVASLMICGFCLTPTMLWAEYKMDIKAPILTVQTEVVIDASKQDVWDELIGFSRIAPPTEAIFNLGVAYPIEAKIFGTGKGAVRHCIFTTGKFVEPIEVWDEPRQLRFSVEEYPEPMQELSFHNNIDAPHLKGYMASVQGEFLLEDTEDGKVRLIGTTWYYNKMWPQTYWKLWADFILHKVHYRVLNHIKKEAEKRSQIQMAFAR